MAEQEPDSEEIVLTIKEEEKAVEEVESKSEKKELTP